MSKSKGAAKAAPAKKRARKNAKPRALPEHLLVPVDPGDWPTNLDDKQAADLFALIECGKTMKKAAEEAGLEYNAVAQWKRRHKRFTERMEEAIDIGIDAQIDDGVDISDMAVDRDTAAASKERREARKDYRRDRRPERFNTSPFKAVANNGDEVLVGVIVVPAKQKTLPGDERFIDAEFKQIEGPEA